MSTLQKALANLGIKLALLKANGDAKSNRAYCTKADPEGFFEVGNINSSGKGARTDLDSVVQTVRAGVTIEELVDKHPVEMIKFTRGITFVKSVMDKANVPEERDITVTVYYGQGGTGKTQHAHIDARRLGIKLFVLSPPSTDIIYWGSYTNELGLLIDDYNGFFKPHTLYRVLDRYRFEVNLKFGQTWARWTHVWITSNTHPENFYSNKVFLKLDPDAYFRRFHNIYRLDYFNEEKNAVALPLIEKEEKPLYFPVTSSVQNTSTPAEEEDSS